METEQPLNVKDQRSKSQSKEKQTDLKEDKVDKEKQKQQDEEKERKRQQKKMKRDKKKQKKLDALREQDSSREMSSDELNRKRDQSKIWTNVSIREDLKKKYVDIEFSKVQLCVGNIPFNAQESELKEYLETILITLKPALAIKPPITHIEIGETKNFAIITLIDRQARNLCLKCDIFEYQGYRLQICKPKGFFDKIYDTNKAQDPFGNIQMGVEETENQLYMGNIPTYLKDYEVKKICESFGMLKFFKLMQQKNDQGEWVSKGYCFFEYSDSKVAENAVKGLNNLELGKNKLRVSIAQTETAQNIAAEQKPKEASNVIGGSFLATYSGIVNPTIQKMLDIPLCAITPSKVIQILNMATPEDLIDDEYYEILCEDVMQECSKYGNIEKMDIPRPDLKTGAMGPNVGKVFVKFDFLIPAKKCRHHINGRIYNKKTVIASFYDEQKFARKEYLLKL